jgi:hypothetical protein
MNIDGFKEWLIANKIYKSPKLVIDCVSRAQRVEKAFQAIKPVLALSGSIRKIVALLF